MSPVYDRIISVPGSGLLCWKNTRDVGVNTELPEDFPFEERTLIPFFILYIKMAGRVLLILPTLVWVSGGILLQVCGVSAVRQIRALQTDETSVKMDYHSASSNSSHHLISGKTVVPEASLKRNNMTWRHLQCEYDNCVAHKGTIDATNIFYLILQMLI